MRLPADGARWDEREVWPEVRWRGLVRRLLRAQLRHAWETMPFHHGRMAAAGLAGGQLRSMSDLERLPLLTKADVLGAMREAGGHLVGMEERVPPGTPSALGMSSGTLGTAVLVYSRGWREATARSLARAYWWAGLRPGKRVMIAAPAWHSMALQETWVVEHLGGEVIVPWGTFLPRFAPGFVDALVDRRPAIVTTFLPMLYAMIAECRSRGLAPTSAFAGVETVLVVGAPITPRARERLAADLGVARVLDGAGSAEGLIAMECEAGEAHHVFVDTCHVEILDPDSGRSLPPGTRGSIVITSLARRGSAYLRYDTEDVGEILAAPCPCGRTWPRLEIYDRRVNRFRVGGRDLYWYDVRVCLDEVPELVGVPFAVIRASGDGDALRLAVEAPREGAPAALSGRAARLVAERLGVPLQLEWTSELPTRWKGVTVIDERAWRSASHV